MNKNYEVKFKDTKKDRAGYATILVEFGDYYVPVKGIPVKLDMNEAPDLDEVKRLNLTNWKLKDIPEIAKLVGDICSGQEAMLYWNGAEAAWKFYDEPFKQFFYDDSDDAVIHALENDINVKIDIMTEAGKFYRPHVDHEGNFGDESVHAVYDFGKNEKKSKLSGLKERLVEDGIEWLKTNAESLVEDAQDHHKKIPYAEIGAALRELTKGMDDVDFAKAWLQY